MKTCSKCGQTKPVDEFNRDKNRKDGRYPHCRECHRADNRARYAADPSKKLAQNAEWQRENRDKVAVIYKRWADKNTDRLNEYNRQWRAATGKGREYAMQDYWKNREARMAANRAWQKANPDIVAAISAKWRAENPEQKAAYSRNYKARKKAAEGTHTGEDIADLYAEQDGRCFYCSVDLGTTYHVDHYIPLSKGGRNDKGNLRLACQSCNLSKKDKHPEEFRPPV